MSDLITRAREYLTDKYLDVADVPEFIKEYVRLHQDNLNLEAQLNKFIARINELNNKVAEQHNTIGWLEVRVESLEDELHEMYMEPL